MDKFLEKIGLIKRINPPPTEVYMFVNRITAEVAGFGGPKGLHHADPNMVAWWPDKGREFFYGRHLSKVVCSEHLARNAAMRSRQASLDFNETVRTAQMQLRIEPKIWIEL